MKRKLLSFLLALCLALSLLPSAALAENSTFADVKSGDWYYEAVNYVSSNGLMTGTDKGFEPSLAVSRAMLWTILSRMSGVDMTAGGEWYTPAQRWAVENDVSDGTEPGRAITREQLAAMLYRYAVGKGIVKAAATEDLGVYADAADISSYARSAMQWVTAIGVINGADGKLDPQGIATRAQVATMLMRLCETLELTEKLYTVTFIYDDGTRQTVTVKKGEKLVRPANPARSGYSFAGWYTDPDGRTAFDFDAVLTEDVVLYPRWTKQDNVSYLPPHSHHFTGTVATPAACEESGVMIYRCSCGVSYTESIPALGHAYGETWTADGKGMHSKTCAVCGNILTENCTLVKTEEDVWTCDLCGFAVRKDERREAVASWEELKTAIGNGGAEVFLDANIAIEEPIVLTEDSVIYGRGHTLTIADEAFTSGKVLFNNTGSRLTLDSVVIDGENKDRTNCLVLIKNNDGGVLTVSNSEIKNFKGTQIIASREGSGTVTIANTSIHDNELKTVEEGLSHGTYHNYYTEELASLIWIQKNDVVFRNVSIMRNTISTGGEGSAHEGCLGNGVLIFFSGIDGRAVTLEAENLIIEENQTPRHIFATYGTMNINSYTFASGRISSNTVDDPTSAIFVVGNLTVGEGMKIESDIVINNDGKKGVCTLTNNGTIIGDIRTADWAHTGRGDPVYTGTGTHTGTKTYIDDQSAVTNP